MSIDLLEVHGPDGQVTFVNVNEISSLREPTNVDLHRYFPKGAHCIIVTTNGKFIAAVEYCNSLREQLVRQSLGRE